MGWIEAVANPNNDRNLLVHLLPKGRDLLKQLDQELG